MFKVIIRNRIIMTQLMYVTFFIFIFFTSSSSAQHNDSTSDQAGILFQEGSELSRSGTKDGKEKALLKLEEAARLYDIASNKQMIGMTFILMGNINKELNKNQVALEIFQKAYQIYKELDRKAGQGMALHSIGTIYYEEGSFQKAFDNFSKALALQESVNNTFDQMGLYGSIGNIFADMGESEKALFYYDKALQLSANTDYSILQNFAILTNISSVYVELGKYEDALSYLELTFSYYRSSGDYEAVAGILVMAGDINLKIGNKKEAFDFFQNALNTYKYLGDKKSEAVVLTRIGETYYLMGEKEKSLEYYQKALPLNYISKSNNDTPYTLGSLMEYWANQGKRDLAILWGKLSIYQFQRQRQSFQLLDKQAQKSYLKRIEGYYRRLANLLIESNRENEAVQILNAFKDQQFYDFGTNQTLKSIFFLSREAKLKESYERLVKNIENAGEKNIETANLSENSAQRTDVKEELEKSLKEFLAVYKEFETELSKPADEKDKVGDIPDTREMQTSLRNLNQQTGQKVVAVYTLVGEDNFRALIVSPDGIKAVSSPIKGNELNEKALKLWGLLQSDKYDPTVLSKQIYDAVFKPLEAELPKDTTTIMWSLDGNLRYLPMAALWDGKQFLAERFDHVIFTRADAERMTRAVNPNWTGTGFGTTQAQTVDLLGSQISFDALPGVTAELAEIFKQTNSKTGILTGEVLPDKKFTKANFIESMKQKRPVVHIASHFSFRPGDEARSFLLLGDGTAFTLSDMKAETNLFQGVDLLTLSACNTAATQQDANGREIDGFAELAQRLGAGAVMATLWSVSDASTPWLMRDFYANRQSKIGMTKTEALRKAQLGLLNGTAEIKPLPEALKGTTINKVQIVIIPKGGKRDANDTRSGVFYLNEAEAPLYKKDDKKPFAHPFYWSPFIFIGNWK